MSAERYEQLAAELAALRTDSQLAAKEAAAALENLQGASSHVQEIMADENAMLR